MTKKERELLVADWRVIFDKSKDIDPYDQEDWRSLAIGFALGKGLAIDDAHDFVHHLMFILKLI